MLELNNKIILVLIKFYPPKKHHNYLSVNLDYENSMYTILISMITSSTCVYIGLHWPVQIDILIMVCICTQLPYNIHLNTSYQYRTTLWWIFIMIKPFI